MRTDTGLHYLGKSPRWAIIHVTKKLNTQRDKTQLLLIKIIPNNLITTSCVAKHSEVVFKSGVKIQYIVRIVRIVLEILIFFNIKTS